MKWIYIIVSMFLHFLIAILFVRLSRFGSGIPGVFGWFFVYWLITLLLTALMIVLRLFKILKKETFAYIYLGVGCFLTGLFGLFAGVGDIHRDLLWFGLYLITIVIGSAMLSDTIIFNSVNLNTAKSK